MSGLTLLALVLLFAWWVASSSDGATAGAAVPISATAPANEPAGGLARSTRSARRRF